MKISRKQQTRRRRSFILFTLIVCCTVGLLVFFGGKDSIFILSQRSHDTDYDYDYYEDWFFNGSNSSFIFPTPTPQPDPTCQALQRLADRTGVFSCSTNDECTGLHCTSQVLGTFDMVIEPCENPPAVYVSGTDPLGDHFNETIDGSREEILGNILTLNITLEQSPDEDSIVFGVVAVPHSPLFRPTEIVPKTTIPLNREQCDFTPPPIVSSAVITSSSYSSAAGPTSVTTSLTPSLTLITSSTPIMPPYTSSYSQPPDMTSKIQPSSTHAAVMSTSFGPLPSTEPTLGGGQSNTLAIAIPVSLVVFLLCVAVLVIVLVVALKKRKLRRREYHFQRMTFSNIQDDDDDDEDL